ncbi:uncharacterized protein PODANS_5_6870 [Podospora anserina S mat+]|uniref:Podospora anserina S mat+ genomic DNA chromosome 5, supercontig 8 n=1 Tax=Podospora anserina (strain S / ATCC MYA-4624 / DSM 980 / FGSC 10383) TaxID=515849 RepID=B2AMI0_PODAN|nr:uncharacterized protein PODANS_5_6870 [Podospora anserina S mat+]CAP65103.1 unnamed protein product [Podospora anserina S mat+]CDP29807.1 Putative protein of unknown function [Podospora anserina S mat+]
MPLEDDEEAQSKEVSPLSPPPDHNWDRRFDVERLNSGKGATPEGSNKPSAICQRCVWMKAQGVWEKAEEDKLQKMINNFLAEIKKRYTCPCPGCSKYKQHERVNERAKADAKRQWTTIPSVYVSEDLGRRYGCRDCSLNEILLNNRRRDRLMADAQLSYLKRPSTIVTDCNTRPVDADAPAQPPDPPVPATSKPFIDGFLEDLIAEVTGRKGEKKVYSILVGGRGERRPRNGVPVSSEVCARNQEHILEFISQFPGVHKAIKARPAVFRPVLKNWLLSTPTQSRLHYPRELYKLCPDQPLYAFQDWEETNREALEGEKARVNVESGFSVGPEVLAPTSDEVSKSAITSKPVKASTLVESLKSLLMPRIVPPPRRTPTSVRPPSPVLSPEPVASLKSIIPGPVVTVTPIIAPTPVIALEPVTSAPDNIPLTVTTSSSSVTATPIMNSTTVVTSTAVIAPEPTVTATSVNTPIPVTTPQPVTPLADIIPPPVTTPSPFVIATPIAPPNPFPTTAPESRSPLGAFPTRRPDPFIPSRSKPAPPPPVAEHTFTAPVITSPPSLAPTIPNLPVTITPFPNPPITTPSRQPPTPSPFTSLQRLTLLDYLTYQAQSNFSLSSALHTSLTNPDVMAPSQHIVFIYYTLHYLSYSLDQVRQTTSIAESTLAPFENRRYASEKVHILFNRLEALIRPYAQWAVLTIVRAAAMGSKFVYSSEDEARAREAWGIYQVWICGVGEAERELREVFFERGEKPETAIPNEWVRFQGELWRFGVWLEEGVGGRLLVPFPW